MSRCKGVSRIAQSAARRVSLCGVARACILVFMLVSSLGSHAQSTTQATQETFKFDAGVGLGMSGYLGDVNESNMFKHVGLAFDGSFRYLWNTRFAIRGIFKVTQLSGNSAEWDNILPGAAQYEFKSWVYDLGGRFEFNFFNYGMGESYKQLKRLSPYVSLGAGVTLSSCDGSTFTALNLPISVGLKYKLKPRINLDLEFTMTKVLGDHVDGHISDLYLIKSSFLKNTDWYATVMFSVSYEFGRRCVVCNRLD